MYWDMSAVTGMNFMLAGCTNLDVDLSNWDVSSIKNAEGFMAGAGLSTMNYDRILSGWSSQPVQSGVTISFGDTKYSIQSGELYRNALLSSGWVITDGGRPPIGFISTWNTTFTDGGGYPEATASTANDTVSLPLTSNGVYDFGVDWGDGSQDQITSYNQSEVTHQYSSTESIPYLLLVGLLVGDLLAVEMTIKLLILVGGVHWLLIAIMHFTDVLS